MHTNTKQINKQINKIPHSGLGKLSNKMSIFFYANTKNWSTCTGGAFLSFLISFLGMLV